ncbi:MAG: SDR family oxidoreductase [Opitutus sp.]
MKVFLTGSSGLVGAALARAASRRGHHVVGVVGRYRGDLEGVAEKLTMDLTQPELVKRSLLDVFPDVIVNCAAISEPAACDADPIGSEAMNVGLPRILAEVATHLGARLIHISSEQVFDGERETPYAEPDEVRPINLYGRQKLASERDVLRAAPTTAIVRAPLLMGDSPGGRRGLHERMLLDWSAGRTPRLFTDEFRQPCTAENLAEVLLELAERPGEAGVFHWAGMELLSRYDLGIRIREHFKLSEHDAPIITVSRSAVPDIARGRQPCLAIDLNRLAARLKTRPQTIAEQLGGLKVPPPCRDWFLRPH